MNKFFCVITLTSLLAGCGVEQNSELKSAEYLHDALSEKLLTSKDHPKIIESQRSEVEDLRVYDISLECKSRTHADWKSEASIVVASSYQVSGQAADKALFTAKGIKTIWDVSAEKLSLAEVYVYRVDKREC